MNKRQIIDNVTILVGILAVTILVYLKRDVTEFIIFFVIYFIIVSNVTLYKRRWLKEVTE